MCYLAAQSAQALPVQDISVSNATVFLSGAQVSGSARVSLVKGENDVVLGNVAGDVNSQTIVVNATNGATVEAVSFQNNYLGSDNISPAVKLMKDSIELVNGQRDVVNNKLMVINEQIAILQENRKVSGNANGLSVAELQKMLDLANSKWDSYLAAKTEKARELKKIDEHLARLNAQLAAEQSRGYQPGGAILVKLYAKEATSSTINVQYVTPNAGWKPVYDIIADDSHSPIKVVYKANVYQNTGIAWPGVHLTLSTGNPDEDMQAPELTAWYLAFSTYKTLKEVVVRSHNAFTTAAPAAGYAVDGVQMYRKNNFDMSQGSVDEVTVVDNGGVNTTFDIDLPYSIPSDGQEHLVAVKKYEAPATFQYYAVPKMGEGVFLQAQITNWQDLNLLAGPTNIFYEGSYVGNGKIDPQNVKDTLSVSLGRDKKVIMKRELDKKERSVKTIGSNVRESFAYNITVRNTRKESANIVIADQLPVSNDKDIVIEDVDNGGAEQNESTGELRWRVSLAPNESKVLHFSYTVKYPKGKTVSGLR